MLQQRPSSIRDGNLFRPPQLNNRIYPNGTPTDPTCPASVCALRVLHIAIRPSLPAPKPLQIGCRGVLHLRPQSPLIPICAALDCVLVLCYVEFVGREVKVEADEWFGLQLFVIGVGG